MRLHVMGDEERGKDSGSRQSRGALELSRAMTNINTNHQQDTKHQTPNTNTTTQHGLYSAECATPGAAAGTTAADCFRCPCCISCPSARD
jgi:hypothetical protein